MPNFVERRFVRGSNEIGIGRCGQKRQREAGERRDGGMFEKAVANPPPGNDFPVGCRKPIDTRKELFVGPTAFAIVDRSDERAVFRWKRSAHDADELDERTVTTQASAARIGRRSFLDRAQARTEVERCLDRASSVFQRRTIARRIGLDTREVFRDHAREHRAIGIARAARYAGARARGRGHPSRTAHSTHATSTSGTITPRTGSTVDDDLSAASSERKR